MPRCRRLRCGIGGVYLPSRNIGKSCRIVRTGFGTIRHSKLNLLPVLKTMQGSGKIASALHIVSAEIIFPYRHSKAVLYSSREYVFPLSSVIVRMDIANPSSSAYKGLIQNA